MRRDFVRYSWAYGTWVGFVCAELYIIGLALYSFFFVHPLWGFVALLYGQLIGALPAIFIGTICCICASILAYTFPHTIIRVGGALWGFAFSIVVLIIASGPLVWLLEMDIADVRSILDFRASYKSDPEYFIAFWTVIALYLCSGVWAGLKLEKLTRLYCQNNWLPAYSE